MTQKSIHLLAVLALLVQAVVGPAAHAGGVALCVSFGICGKERAVETNADCHAVTACCSGCSATVNVRSDVRSAVPNTQTTLIPVIALRPPCGSGCSDCVDLEIDGDPTLTSPRTGAIPGAVCASIECVSMRALWTASADLAWLTLGSGQSGGTGPPRSPAHAPMLRAVRLRL